MLDEIIFFQKYVFLSLAFRSSMSIDAKSSDTPISPTITTLSHVRNTVGGFNAVNDWQFHRVQGKIIPDQLFEALSAAGKIKF